MNRTKRCLLTLALVLPGLAFAQQAVDILKAADKFRASSQNLQLETSISVSAADGSGLKERRYTVFVQAKHKSLVLMQSPAEKGQRVLMLADDFWLVMPGSVRPMRITPMQKLLGDASTGDIATMSWSEDYSPELVGEEECEAVRCLHLKLTALRKGVTYQRIELWVGKSKYEPIRADLYVQSEKLAKEARFVMDKPAAPVVMVEMLLSDKLSNHKQTRVRYLERKERTVPDAWLNPMFLATNPKLD